MSGYEEELQKRIESNKSLSESDVDTKAYRQVFRALEREPEFSLPPSFADKVLSRIEQKKSGSLSNEYFWLIMGLVLSVVVFGITLVVADFKMTFGFLNAVSSYKGLFIFGLLFIFLFQYLDKKLIRDKETTV
jgi:hypothetical protein